jgi:hypothetical protein
MLENRVRVVKNPGELNLRKITVFPASDGNPEKSADMT